jgi:transposase
MKINNIDVDATLANVRQQLQDDHTVSPSVRAAVELLIVVIQILMAQLDTDSADSRKPSTSRKPLQR